MSEEQYTAFWNGRLICRHIIRATLVILTAALSVAALVGGPVAGIALIIALLASCGLVGCIAYRLFN